MSPTEVFAFPLSYAQERLWFLDQLVPHSPLYNIAIASNVRVAVSPALLEKSINEIVRRHEVLRSVFGIANGQPAQIVSSELHIPLRVVNLSERSPDDRRRESVRIANEEALAPFDLGKGPLLRTTLLTQAPKSHILVLVIHHIVSDAWSTELLFSELTSTYTSLATGTPSSLRPLPIQYADFAIWQRQWLESGILQKQLSYWETQLRDLPQLRLPTDYPRPSLQTFAGQQQLIKIPPEAVASLYDLSHREGVTPFMTLLTAFQILLSRYSGQEDIVVGTPIAGRGRPEVEALIGFFINTLVVRTDCSGNPTFLQMLRRVRDVMLDAYANQDVPFEKVVQHLHVERDVGRNPLFQIMFQLRTAPRRSQSGPAYDPPIPVERNTSIFDLSISLWESQDVLEGSIEYSTDLFHPETISRLASHYQTLLEAVISNPEQRIRDLPLLTPSERSELLAKWNGAEPPPLANDRIHRVVEAVVENVPDSIAVAFEEYRITYRDLNERANRLAHYLCDLEIGPDVLVGICLDRSPEMVVAILAILKAGGAYLPLDPAYPQERIAFILRDAQPRIVLTTRTLANILSGHDVRAICLDNISKVLARKSSMNLPERATGDNLAYVIYTSGSTGTPKGVLVCHRGLCNVAESQVALLPLGRNDHALQFASLTFDASIFEMLLAFGAGATLYLGKQQDLLPGAPLNEFINANGITVVTLPPSVLATLSPDRCSSLTTVLVAGEACSAALVAMWSPGRHFFNLYGPTEATIWSTAARCTLGTAKRSPPIGRPIPRTKIYVLDGNAQPAPIGIPGEIHIGGYGLARGYLNRPELTNQRFITVGLTDSGKERLYKTGDLARYLPDGQIEFLGRVDNQLKVRGFRIEPGEIETKLKQHESIQDAIVIATDGDAGARSLVAYIVPVPGKVIVQTELSDFLEERLPKFMVPAQYMFLETLPRLPSGKVARKMLPKPTPTTTTQAQELMPPQSALEQSIANVWKEILKLERVGVEDNFFDLGGNSLSLAALHARVAQLVSKEVPLIEMFRRPTIRSLVSYVDSSAVGTSAGSSHVRERAQRKLAVAQHNYR